MEDLTLFEALTGEAFDRLNWQHSGEFDQNFSKKSNAPGFARGGGWAVLELTGTLPPPQATCRATNFSVASCSNMLHEVELGSTFGNKS